MREERIAVLVAFHERHLHRGGRRVDVDAGIEVVTRIPCEAAPTPHSIGYLRAKKEKWNRGGTKPGAIVPKKIAEKYGMSWRGTAEDKTDQMGVSSSTDMQHWSEETDAPVLPRRVGKFDSRVVEPGPPPMVTPDGIVLVYNGADDNLVYRTGIAVFDKNDPRKVLYRSEAPVFAPELDWEKNGQVPNVVFVEGMAKHGKEWLFYYGGADKYVGVATASAGSERVEALDGVK